MNTKRAIVIFLIIGLTVILASYLLFILSKQSESKIEPQAAAVNLGEGEAEKVKVKPASIELEERNDENKDEAEPAVTEPVFLDADFTELDELTGEAREAEAVADTKVKKFKSFKDSLDRDLNFLLLNSNGGLNITFNLKEIATEDEALNCYRQGETEEEQIACLQKLGKLMLNRRIWSLALGKARLETVSRVEVSQLVSQLEADFDSLKNLKNEISLTNDLAPLKEKIPLIVTDYYIYLVTLPKVYGLVAVDGLRIFSDKLDNLTSGVKIEVGQLVEVEQDVTEGESLIALAQEQINLAADYLQTAEQKLFTLDISNSEEARTIRKAARDDLLDARVALKDAFKQLRLAVDEMKELVEEYNQLLEEEAEVSEVPEVEEMEEAEE